MDQDDLSRPDTPSVSAAAGAQEGLAAPPGDPAAEGVLFARPLTARAIAAWLVAFVASVLAAAAHEPVALAARDLAAALPFPPAANAVDLLTRLALGLSPVFVVGACLSWGSRRHARVRIGPDLVVWSHPFAPWRWARMLVPLADVVERRDTASGIVLVTPRLVDGVTQRTNPMVVPVQDDAEAARAHALLDGASPGGGGGAGRPPTRTGGNAPTAVLAGLVVVLVPAALAMIGAFAGGGAATGCVAALALLAFCVAVFRGTGRFYVPLHVSQHVVVLRAHAFRFTDLVAASCAGPWVTLEGREGLRRQAWVGRDAASVRAALAVGLGERAGAVLAERPPSWAARSRRRDLALALATGAVLGVIGVVAPLDARRCVVHADHHGQTLVDVRGPGGSVLVAIVAGCAPVGSGSGSALDDPALRRPVRVETGRLLWTRSVDNWFPPVELVTTGLACFQGEAEGEPAATLDLRAGRVLLPGGRAVDLAAGATFVAAGPDGVETGAPDLERLGFTMLVAGARYSAGDLLDMLLPASPDPAVRRAVEGRTTVRCVARSDAAGDELVARIERGLVVGVVAIDGGRRAPVAAPADPCPACALAEAHRGRFVRLVADGSTRAAPLPALDGLLDALARLRRGQAVATVAAPLAPGLWAP